MDREKLSGIFDEVLSGDIPTASDQIAALSPEERRTVLSAPEDAEAEAEACAGRGTAIRAVLERFR